MLHAKTQVERMKDPEEKKIGAELIEDANKDSEVSEVIVPLPVRENDEEKASVSSSSLVKTAVNHELTRYILIPVVAIMVSLAGMGHGELVLVWMLIPLGQFVQRVVGTLLGIGLGLGLATHIYDRLEVWHLHHHPEHINEKNGAVTFSKSSPRGFHKQQSGRSVSSGSSTLRKSSTAHLQEESTYVSWMTAAGYDVSDQVLRGQVVWKKESTFLQTINYPYTHVEEQLQAGPQLMKLTCPQLPTQVSHQLGRWIEHIIRDYVSTWYSMIDGSCPYQNEREYRAELLELQKENETEENSNEAGQGSTEGTTNTETPTEPTEPAASSKSQRNANARAMILNTRPHRPIPLMGAMYHSLAIAFGNLSTRVEHLNVFELLILKWTKVLSATLRTYRQLRVLAVAKQQVHEGSNQNRRGSALNRSVTVSLRRPSRNPQQQPNNVGDPLAATATSVESPTPPRPRRRFQRDKVSEIAMAKEFLLAGKLHRAVTFGMDVPSLLFADPSGKECRDVADKELSEEEVLEERLFASKMVFECEMDYNRVLANRLCRALLPRSEFSSPIIRSLLTELMSGCILCPIMGCFAPDYLNYWITLATAPKEGSTTSSTEEEVTTQNGEQVEPSIEVCLDEDDRSVGLDLVEETPAAADISRCSDEAIEMTLSKAVFLQTSERSLGENGIVVNDSESDEENEGEEDNEPTGDLILPLLTMAVIELQRYMDFEDCREAKTRNEQLEINWDEKGCRDAVCHLVLVIEAALIHGRKEKSLAAERIDEVDAEEEAADEFTEEDMPMDDMLPPLTTSSLTQILMELTSDLDAFEAVVEQEESRQEDPSNIAIKATASQESDSQPYKPSKTELSTLRTLISAWLHTGQIFRTVSVLVRAQRTVLAPFYREDAFLRVPENASGFVRQLRSLDDVDVLVDTSSVLASASLNICRKVAFLDKADDLEEEKQSESNGALPEVGSPSAGLGTDSFRNSRLTRFISGGSSQIQSTTRTANTEEASSTRVSALLSGGNAEARYLDFHRNKNFANSLRSERERRSQSWNLATQPGDENKNLKMISRLKGSTDEDFNHFRELHQIARMVYTGTIMMALRDGARRKETTEASMAPSSNEQTDGSLGGDQGEAEIQRLSLLTVELASPRRRLEIPDDDSSFLLRAQPRPLNAIGVHRDQMNHDASFKSFAATYEEPAIRDGSRYTGGRYIRRCQLRYYPSDRTATILVPKDARSLDQRKFHAMPPETISFGTSSAGVLSGDFLRERHLCRQWTPKGAAPRSSSILASSVMEPADFCAAPRSGKALDFLYRMSLFERPMVELSGKVFTIHDSAVTGTHRADASSLELSDASLSVALLLAGRDWEETPSGSIDEEESTGTSAAKKTKVEMGADGYPIMWMKFSRKQGDNNVVEIKPYRTSYVRAALMIASTKFEAQQQCLLECVRHGSARNATRQRTEALMQPTLKLLEFANSWEREKQAIILRDLKLGINHIDREQLRRNSLLYPRYPTIIRSLKATVEGSTQTKDSGKFGGQGSMVVFKIRCVALVELIETEEDEVDMVEYRAADGSAARTFREEWVVHRPFRDFNVLHKHLKTQVAVSETSGNAGSRLVDAATAAFAGGANPNGRHRKALIPSLGQASKAGALVVTQKSLHKRRLILDEYLKHFLSPTHPMNQCAELMLFLGANHPLPPDVRTGEGMVSGPDFLGRTDMFRTALESVVVSNSEVPATDKSESSNVPIKPLIARAESEPIAKDRNVSSSLDSPLASARSASAPIETDEGNAAKEAQMIPAIKTKIDQVPLGKVRNAIFELIRSQFDFENASFFRNRLLAALKTVSFAATSASGFRQTLYDAHIQQFSADAVAGWVQFGLNMVWPDGIFFQSAPPNTPEQSRAIAEKSLKMLSEAFPDQVRAILGQDITQDGLEMLHEMIQNRLVMKSLAYMLFDLLWIELFPDLSDILTCGEAIDIQFAL